jgi:hypothetical protein
MTGVSPATAGGLQRAVSQILAELQFAVDFYAEIL